MIFITILLGIACLGIVVFFHEFGHFIAARLVGIEVTEFSLGWGPKLLGYRTKKTHYRISVFPVGGYCKMKGDEGYKKAIEENLETIPYEKGSFFSAPPYKRIIVALAGPFMNIVFAFLAFILITGIGYKENSWSNRIVLASEYDSQEYPADLAGFASGDHILQLDKKSIKTYSDLQEFIAFNPKKETRVLIERDGVELETIIIPMMDRESAIGKIGVLPWIDPLIDSIVSGGPADFAGLLEGDLVVEVDGLEITHVLDFTKYLEANTPVQARIVVLRNDEKLTLNLIPEYSGNGEMNLGFGWKSITRNVRSENLAASIRDGYNLTISGISGTYRAIAHLFMGANVLKVLSGPARITWIAGQTVSNSLSADLGSGFSYVLNFLAILSIGLFAMNLLPIPLLDGGSIILYLVEWMRKKALKVKTVLRYQTIGIVFVGIIFVLTMFGDILFFSGR